MLNDDCRIIPFPQKDVTSQINTNSREMYERKREEAFSDFVAWASAKESLKATEAFLGSYSSSSVKDSRFNHLEGLPGFLELTVRSTSLFFMLKLWRRTKTVRL